MADGAVDAFASVAVFAFGLNECLRGESVVALNTGTSEECGDGVFLGWQGLE